MRRLSCLVVLWLAGMPLFAAPPTLDKPGKKVRFLSLAEARAIALEQGKGGQPSLLFPGIGTNNATAVPQETQSAGSDSIRVLADNKPGSKNILLTGVRRNPRPAECERNVNQMLLNVENAYWNLYGSYYQLYSREQALRFAYETWKITAAQFRVGKVNEETLAQAEGQYNLFRTQRLQALDTVLDNERQLRAIMGIRIKDGTRLVPSDAPTLVEKKPDWEEGMRRALKHRPELRLARQDVKLAIFNADANKNIQDAPQSNEEMQAHQTAVRKANLEVARARLVEQDQELKTERLLGLYYRRMSSAYSQIKAARAQREAFATQLQICYELYRAGANENAQYTLNPSQLFQAQRFWAEALATEYQAIVTYNNAIAGWEYAKGDMMKHAHVRLVEEAPSEDAVRAVVREHKRTRQHVRRATGGLERCSAEIPTTAPSLPALWKSSPLLKKAGELPSAPDGKEPLIKSQVSGGR